ncbi:hypothetical protein BZA77DRAFT_355925 [Pyronema omphalodes]|nr:hypothetical protein BZA77DRAFT_355925 [Pyronema omphalodes]
MAAPASASQASSMHMFTLPPPALAEQQAADATTRKKRRTSQSTSTNTSSPSIAASVTLPPPPTRTRKIIQMKPTPAVTTSPSLAASNSPPTKPTPKPRATKTAAPKTAAATSTTTTTSPTNAASAATAAATSTSRKVARKTAHSLIERRRRSKMNAEFESLKNLVPACKGVEMHKLAILQASIEYVRYLEGCVKELQKASGVRSCCEPPVFSTPQRTSAGEEEEEEQEQEQEQEQESGEDVDIDMEETEQEKDTTTRRRRSDGSLNQRYDEYLHHHHYTTNTTPSSAASVVSATSPDFGPVHSATTSPIFTLPAHGIRLPSISPMLFPQPAPACHSPMEATAGALLLLADEGRRESCQTDRYWRNSPPLPTSPSQPLLSIRRPRRHCYHQYCYHHHCSPYAAPAALPTTTPAATAPTTLAAPAAPAALPTAMGTADNESAVAQHAEAISQRRTLFVRSLPYSVTSDTLSSTFSFVAPIKHATVVINPANKQSRGFGFVTFADAEDAQRAVKDMDGKEIEGRKIKVELAEPRSRKDGAAGGSAAAAAASENKKALPMSVIPERIRKQKEETAAHGEVKKRSPRLIVRNLPWSVKSPEQLLKFFMPHGKVKDIIIPKKKSGEMSGFAFITMKGYKNAASAMEAVNGVEIEGRTVAVDWAVEKSEWETKREAEKPAQADAEEEEDDDEEEGEEDEEDDEEGDEDEEDDEEGDEEEDEMDEDDDEDMDSEDEAPPTDTETTLFIRNLPYSATDDSVYQHFTKFGPVHYARIVIDHSTGRPKGTGFVRFYSADIARDCLRGAPKATTGPESTHSLLQSEALDPDGLYTLDGRILALSRAVEKSRAEELTSTNAKEREKGNNDKRRLYLVNEGAIPLTIPLPPSERLLRDQSRDQRKKLLQADPNLHLSLTRLSIRNLPRWVTSKDLKHFARKAIPGFAEDLKAGKRAPLSREELQRDGGEGKAAEEARRAKGVGVVKQAKVQLEKAGGRSRGYGFVEYWSHRYALMGLRYMNGQMVPGSPPQEEKEELWGKGDAKGKGKPAKNQPPRRPTAEMEKGKRMIVEFAIENAKVVKRRQENEQKSREIGAKRKEMGLKPNEKPKNEGDKKSGPLKKGKKTTGGQKERKKEFGKKRKREDNADDAADGAGAKKNKNWNKKTEKIVKDVAVGGPTPKKQPMDEKTLEIIRKKRMARRNKGGK